MGGAAEAGAALLAGAGATKAVAGAGAALLAGAGAARAEADGSARAPALVPAGGSELWGSFISGLVDSLLSTAYGSVATLHQYPHNQGLDEEA